MLFSNDPTKLLENINKLPEVIVDIIQLYIPLKITIFLKKESYISNHLLLREYIQKQDIENYIRSMIRQDNDFVFSQLLKENYSRWINMKKCYYKNSIYANYLVFLDSYCLDNESVKCKIIINNLFEELGLRKNRHKKKTVNYIRWKK
jgi:hypothetical protein